jgi:hypothetical protein
LFWLWFSFSARPPYLASFASAGVSVAISETLQNVYDAQPLVDALLSAK